MNRHIEFELRGEQRGAGRADSWTTFAIHQKAKAYRQDQLPCSRPVVTRIHDLEDVLVNFDGITYAKGASVLEQLAAYG